MAPAVLHQRAAAAKLRCRGCCSTPAATQSGSSGCRRQTASWTAASSVMRYSPRPASTPRVRACYTRRPGHRFSSLNAVGEADRRGLMTAGYTVLVKLHENSLDMAYENSGGIDWAARLSPLLRRGTWPARARRERVTVARRGRRAGVRPQLGGVRVPAARSPARADRDARADPARRDSGGVRGVDGGGSTTVSHGGRSAQERGTRVLPIQGTSPRPGGEVAAELFYGPGGATQRARRELYALIELAEPAAPRAPDEDSDSEIAVAHPGVA